MDDVRTPEAGQDGTDAQHGRRALFVAGAAAALGTAGWGTAAAAPATPAVPPPTLVLGRTNDAGRKSTKLEVSSTASGLRVYQSGTGMGIYAQAGREDGLSGTTLSRNAFGVHARAKISQAGSGAALRAEGRYNPGVVADTGAGVRNVPAAVLTGGAGAGIALLARGESYLDGDALALRSWVGVLDPQQKLSYAPVVSAEQACHTAPGTLALDATGSGTVVLAPLFVSAVAMDSLVVTLTARNTAMPGLYVRTTATGFTVAGGVADGAVFWSARADRLVLDITTASVDITTASVPNTATARQTDAVTPDHRRSRTVLGWAG
jgi:hypothetical protein